MARIPASVIGVAAPILANEYTHTSLNSLFLAHGFPGDPPDGNKENKCLSWMRHANNLCEDPLRMFGALIAEFMDTPIEDTSWTDDWSAKRKAKVQAIQAALNGENLSYQRGGRITGADLTGPSRSLGERIRTKGLETAEEEFQRAYEQIARDPPAALTAACAVLEAVCKEFLESNGHPLPAKQAMKELWQAAAVHLKLRPRDHADDDIRRILSGMISVVDGIAALRTRQGTAHGRSTSGRYRLEPRHVRLAVHSAHTIAMFVIESWQDRRAQ